QPHLPANRAALADRGDRSGPSDWLRQVRRTVALGRSPRAASRRSFCRLSVLNRRNEAGRAHLETPGPCIQPPGLWLIARSVGVKIEKRRPMPSLKSAVAIVLALAPRAVAELPVVTNAAVIHATSSVEQGTLRAKADPSRPVYHFSAPAYWMNDPNGPIY